MQVAFIVVTHLPLIVLDFARRASIPR
jgi:hypothetical protein